MGTVTPWRSGHLKRRFPLNVPSCSPTVNTQMSFLIARVGITRHWLIKNYHLVHPVWPLQTTGRGSKSCPSLPRTLLLRYTSRSRGPYRRSWRHSAEAPFGDWSSAPCPGAPTCSGYMDSGRTPGCRERECLRRSKKDREIINYLCTCTWYFVLSSISSKTDRCRKLSYFAAMCTLEVEVFTHLRSPLLSM